MRSPVSPSTANKLSSQSKVMLFHAVTESDGRGKAVLNNREFVTVLSSRFNMPRYMAPNFPVEPTVNNIYTSFVDGLTADPRNADTASPVSSPLATGVFV